MAIGEKTRSPSAASVRNRTIEGVLTRIKQGVATGWAADPSDATYQVRLKAFVDGSLIGSLIADRSGPRRDGEGGARNCGFKFKIPERFVDGEEHVLSIRVTEGGEDLRDSPQSFSMQPSKADETAQAAGDDDASDSEAGSDGVSEYARVALAGRSGAMGRRRTGASVVQLWLDAEDAMTEDIALSLESWARQSVPSAPVLIGSAAAEHPRWADAGCICMDRAGLRPPAEGFVVFGRAGETFHPDLSDLLGALPPDAAGAYWNLGASAQRSRLSGLSALAGGLGASGFAVSAGRLAGGIVEAPLALVGQMRAAWAGPDQWIHIDLALSRRPVSPQATSRSVFGGFSIEALRSALEFSQPRLALQASGDEMLLAPEGTTGSVGVVLQILDADQLGRTLSRLARQNLTLPLELAIAIPSTFPELKELIQGYAPKVLPGVEVKVASTPASAGIGETLALAAEQLETSTLLILSPGVWLTDPKGLETLVAWAHVDGIGAVTARPHLAGAPIDMVSSATRPALRAAGPSDRFYCAAISQRALRLVGPFETIRFPELWDVEWQLRAEAAGLQSLQLNMVRAKCSAMAPWGSETEQALLAAVHARSGWRMDSEQADSALASDRRAAFLMDRLLSERRHSLDRRLELIKEIGALKTQLGDIDAADDILAAIDLLAVKLDRA